MIGFGGNGLESSGEDQVNWRRSDSEDKSEMTESQERAEDPRLEKVVTEGRFIEPYAEELKQLFSALGLGELTPAQIATPEFIEYLRANWIFGDHGKTNISKSITLDQERGVRPILEKMGYFEEILPPDNSQYDAILILGGRRTANERRAEKILDMVQNHHIQAGSVTFLTGQRLREPEDGSDEELIGVTDSAPDNDLSHNPRVIEMIRLSQESGGVEPIMPIETDIAIAEVEKAFPGAENQVMSGMNIPLINANGKTAEEVKAMIPQPLPIPKKDPTDEQKYMPQRVATDFFYDMPVEIDGQAKMIRFTFLNGEPMPRGNDTPRPNTPSIVKEWLERLAPHQMPDQAPPEWFLAHESERLKEMRTEPKKFKVLVMSGNPHTVRTAFDIYQQFLAAGRTDIEVEICGTSAPQNVKIATVLGEVAREIHNDYKLNWQNQEVAGS